MRRRSFNLIKQAAQMGNHYRLQFRGRRCSHAPRLFKGFHHPVQGAVLAEEENVVFAMEVVIEIRRGKLRRLRDVAHPGLLETAGAELPPRSAQNLQATRHEAPLPAATAIL